MRLSKLLASSSIPALLFALGFAPLQAQERKEDQHFSGLVLVGPGPYQARPRTKDQRAAWDAALKLAADNADTLGYPWIRGDAIVHRTRNARGASLAEALSARVPKKLEAAQASFRELERIKDEIPGMLRARVSGASAIVSTQPDDEHNRVIVTVDRIDDNLMVELARRYGTQMLAVRVAPGHPHYRTLASRASDTRPFSGGAHYITPQGKGCTLGVPWTTGMVTAGHCIPNGGDSFSPSGYIGYTSPTTRENYNPGTGTVLFPGDSVYRGDLALIETYTEDTIRPKIYVGPRDSSTTRWVSDMWNESPKVDDQYCTGGAITGEQCGWKVVETRMNYTDVDTGDEIRNVTRGERNHDGPTVKGDSGGPVYTVRSDGTVAVKGIISGGSVSPLAPYSSLFTDILLAVSKFPGTAKTQSVSVPFRVSNRNSLKCLDIRGGSVLDNAEAIQWDCHGETNQHWYYETHPIHPYAVRIINGSGKCLAIGNSSTANGAKAIQWSCIDTSAGQTWYLRPDGTVENKSGKCLAIGSSSLSNGANAIQWDCIGTMTQKWTWSSIGTVP